MAAEGIAKIVAAGGQSGIAREDLLAFAESATKMGIAFDITADQAGDMMAKWRTAFKMNQEEVVALADKVNYLGNTTAASAPLISDVVTRIGPLGEVGGVASGEIAALGASIVGTGTSSEIAATGIKNLILGMSAGAGATKSQAAAFASLGMTAEDVASRMQVDAKGAIIDVMKAIQALDADKQAATLQDLFGKESIGAIAPLLGNLENLQENFDKVADATKYAGAKEAYVVEEPFAAAVGAGLPVTDPTGSMIVDIGGGTTDVATISLGGIVNSRSIRVGGDELNESIVQHVRKTYNLLIGERTAEELKITLGSASIEKAQGSMQVRGRDMVTGLPRVVEVPAKEIAVAMSEIIHQILDAVKDVLEQTPPEISADVIDHGIVLTGGGAMLRHLAEMISKETQVPAFVANDPLDCVALGTGAILANPSLMKK